MPTAFVTALRPVTSAFRHASTEGISFELALLLAVEERPSEDVASISSEIDAEQAPASNTLVTRRRGDPEDPQCIAAAISRVLFGSEGAGDDHDEAFFSGSSQADYYDPRNSYLDHVLERRQGIVKVRLANALRIQYAATNGIDSHWNSSRHSSDHFSSALRLGCVRTSSLSLSKSTEGRSKSSCVRCSCRQSSSIRSTSAGMRCR